MKIISHNVKETENIAKKLAKNLKGNEILAFYGDLGAGKTAFTRGLAEYFGLKDMVSSPTFSIMNEYENESVKIYHFDMYRINSLEDLESTGFFDFIDTGIIIIEWSENINQFLPEKIIEIKIEKSNGNENNRTIEVKGATF